MIIRNGFLAASCVLMGTIVVFAFAPAPVYKPRRVNNDELARAMQGDWKREGGPGGPKARGRTTSRVRIEGDKWTFLPPPGRLSDRPDVRYNIILDKSTAQATIELVQASTNGRSGRRVRLKGIVKIEADLLTICYVSGPAASRGMLPTSFDQTETSSGYRIYTMKLRRAKPSGIDP